MTILIAEDEVRLAEALAQILKDQKYQVDVVYDGRDALDYAESGTYDVIVLDVMMPYLDGFQVVHKLREKRIQTPVIMLTAKDSWQNKVQGLDAGADDYMTKPFQPEELLARIRALSRRQGEVVLDTLSVDDLTLNISTYDLSTAAKSVHLGFKEFEIMRILMSNPKGITPKEDLITKVWGAFSDAEDNNVEAYISFLRRKLTFLGSRVQIGTVRKVGYHLITGGEADAEKTQDQADPDHHVPGDPGTPSGPCIPAAFHLQTQREPDPECSGERACALSDGGRHAAAAGRIG